MSRNLRQLEPAPKITSYKKSLSEDSLPVNVNQSKNNDDDGWGRFGEELAGFFVDASPYIGTLAVGELIAPGLGFAGVLAESAIEIGTNAISDSTTATKQELGLTDDTVPPAINKPEDPEEPFGVTAEQGGSSNDPMMLDEIPDAFGVTASQNDSINQMSKPKITSASDALLASDINSEASMDWLA